MGNQPPTPRRHENGRQNAGKAKGLQQQVGGERAGPSQEIGRRLAGGRSPVLLDVRTDQEWAICRLDGARLIPIQELEARLAELDDVRTEEIVVYCHVGMRSAMAVGFLRRSGFAGAVNLTGGIAAWAAEVEPTMPRY